MNKKIAVTLSVIILVLLVGALSVLLFTGQSVKNQETLKIGVFTPLSGEAAPYGEGMKKGLDLAVLDLNQNGGINGKQVELVYEDTHLDPKESVNVMNKFVYVDKMHIVIAAEGSGVTLAALPIADQTKTLTMVALASTPLIKDSGDYVFRVVPSDAYQGKAIADIAKKLEKKKIAILYLDGAYGVGIKNALKQNSENLIAEESFVPESQDFKTQLLKIKEKNPDLLVVVADTQYPGIFKQVKELGMNVQIVSSETLKQDYLIQASGDSAEGVLFPFYAETTDYVSYKEKFREKYGSDSAVYSDYGYDALMVIAKAAKDAKSTDPEKLKNQLYKETYYGATGIVQFDSDGEVTGKPFVTYQIRQGKPVLLE